MELFKKQPKFPLVLDLQFFADNKDGGSDELKKLQSDFNASWKELKILLDTQADEIRNYGETNSQTADKIKSVEVKISNFEKEVKGFTDKQNELELKLNRVPFGSANPEQLKSPGSLFIESDPYKKMIEQKSYTSSPFQVKSFFRKDLDTSATSGGLFTGTTRIPDVIAPPDSQLTMRDLLNVTPTTSNTIEFIEETGFTNAAAPAPEKSLKPQSDISFDLRDASVKTLAHWIPATRQIINDAPGLQNYVENRLLYGLRLVEDAQFLYGSGTGEDLQGIMTNPGIQNVGNRPTGVTMIDYIRTSITRATLAGYPVTGLVLHPMEWQEIEMAKGADGHYIWVSVVNGGEPRLWRIPVVESTAIVEGEFLLGGFGIGAQVWDREEANIRISESHADYFARNMIAILAEERLALTTYRPESFVRGSFIEGATG